MLLEIAIADAYGAAFEYLDNQIIQQYNNGYSYRQHQLHRLIPGSFTDDTQMSVAIYEYLKDYSFNPELNKSKIADYFYNCYARDKRKGYSSGFQNLLDSISSGKELLEKCNSVSSKNGAAMRSCPIGLLNDTKLIKEFAELQASITHNERGITASVAVAIATYLVRNGKDSFNEVSDYLNSFLGLNEDWLYIEEVRSRDDLGMITAKSAITFALHSRDFHHLLIDCVSVGGDVDTSAAIAAGIFSQRKDYDRSQIPANLLKKLENKKFGRDYIIELEK